MNMLIIIGASGHGKVIADIALKMNKWKEIYFLDDNDSIKNCMGIDIIGRLSDKLTYRNKADFIIAIGNNTIRENIQNELINNDFNVATLVHPGAIIGSDVKIGKGSVIMAGVIINSSSVIGDGCIINTSSSIDHDNVIGNYCHISPGVRTAGSVSLGNGTWLGIGSIVSNNVSITSGCTIGAGTVVLEGIVNSGTYVGVPASRIK